MLSPSKTNLDRDAIPGLFAFAPSSQLRPATLVGVLMDHCAGHEIFGEGEPATLVFRIVSGAVRTFTVLADGRRQIEAFHFPGDVLGLEVEEDYRVSAEAISEVKIVAVKRNAVDAACQDDSKFARELWALTCAKLSSARSQMILLGRKTAVERVATFLVDMSSRAGGSRKFELPMCRYDIADYLGLTIETVSRTFSQLERDGLIVRPSTKGVEIRRPDSLKALVG